MARTEVEGSSLAVPNVQQLASSSKEVPIRYLRPEFEIDQVSGDEDFQVPVIDMSKLVGGPGEDDDGRESAKLHSACKEWGFFQVINHGLPAELIVKMKTDVQEFFERPLEEKMEYAQLPNEIEGYGQAFIVSEEQKLDWGDMLFLLGQPATGRNMQFWPKNPSSFRATLGEYSTELEKLAMGLLSAMARNLGLEPETILALFKEGMQGVRMNYYPPCELASKVIGLAPHSDGTGLTLLTQVNEVQGLQIRKDGKWVPIDPIPGAFIVNVGDILEIMSNGEYKSIEHRAVVNPLKERLSIAAFHGPNLKAMIEPLPDLLVRSKQAAKYKSMSHQDYLHVGEKGKIDRGSRIQQMKVETDEAEQ